MLALICCTLILTILGGLAIDENTTSQEISQPQEFYEVVYHETMSYLFFETTLEGLESRATYIVRGRIADDATTVLLYNDRFDPPRFSMGYTVVSLEIYEVIKGDLTVGDTIRIMETYYIRDDILFVSHSYMPSIPHQEYFFFLSFQLTPDRLDPHQQELAYVIPVVHGSRGRYRVPEHRYIAPQTFDATYLSVATNGNMDLHWRLWQEVIAAYMN